MPKINKAVHFQITPEQFVNACDSVELFELQLELDKRFQRELKNNEGKMYKQQVLKLMSNKD